MSFIRVHYFTLACRAFISAFTLYNLQRNGGIIAVEREKNCS